MADKEKSRLAAFFDTETTSLPTGRAYAYAFIWKPRGADALIYREVVPILEELEALRAEAQQTGVTQIIGAYNLAFDWTTLESAVAAYRWPAGGEMVGWTIDKLEHGGRLLAVDLTPEGAGTPAVRFWDMRPLVPEGLAIMGRLAGVPKLDGILDYDRRRTPATPLTSDEASYMRRDVEILEAFADKLLEWYGFLRESDLGRVAITNASIARLFMRRVAGANKLGVKTVQSEHLGTRAVTAKMAEDWQKELRREAYAGGFTFVNPEFLWRTVSDVRHYDMDSAYHFVSLFQETPTRFVGVHRALAGDFVRRLRELAGRIRRDAKEGIYSCLSEPEGHLRFHARITFEGLVHMKDGAAYALAEGRFDARRLKLMNLSGAPSGRGRAEGMEAEFSKVQTADRLTVTVDENEFAAIALNYHWQAMRVEAAEIATQCERMPLPLTASASLRAEKMRRKAEGGPQYDFFKRIYNSTAGIWAQAAGAEERHSLEYLPLAVRQTSWARLKMACVLDALGRVPGVWVLSGDTDSIKVRGNREDIEATLARVEKFCERPELPEIYGLEAPGLESVGRFEHERTVSLHREMGPKMRAWWHERQVTVKAAGIRSAGIAGALTELAAEQTPREALDALKPWTWIAPDLAKEVKATRPQSSKPFTINAPDFHGKVQPAIHLADSIACIGNPARLNFAERLAIAGKLDGLTEGWLDASGWNPFDGKEAD